MRNTTIGWFREGVLNDDVLYIAEDGHKFNGGYDAILEYWTYRNANANDRNIRRFRTVEAAEKFIVKRYGYDAL